MTDLVADLATILETGQAFLAIYFTSIGKFFRVHSLNKLLNICITRCSHLATSLEYTVVKGYGIIVF